MHFQIKLLLDGKKVYLTKLLYFRRLEGGALSDSEYGLPAAMRSRHQQLASGTGSQTFGLGLSSSSTTDFDKRKRKKHELLEEVIRGIKFAFRPKKKFFRGQTGKIKNFPILKI